MQNILQKVASVLGWVFVAAGVLNIAIPFFYLWPYHSILHLLLGAVGLWSARRIPLAYCLGLGMVLLLLAAVGLAGTPDILGVIDLPHAWNVAYFILGSLCISTYALFRNSRAVPDLPNP